MSLLGTGIENCDTSHVTRREKLLGGNFTARKIYGHVKNNVTQFPVLIPFHSFLFYLSSLLQFISKITYMYIIKSNYKK